MPSLLLFRLAKDLLLVHLIFMYRMQLNKLSKVHR